MGHEFSGVWRETLQYKIEAFRPVSSSAFALKNGTPTREGVRTGFSARLPESPLSFKPQPTQNETPSHVGISLDSQGSAKPASHAICHFPCDTKLKNGLRPTEHHSSPFASSLPSLCCGLFCGRTSGTFRRLGNAAPLLSLVVARRKSPSPSVLAPTGSAVLMMRRVS